MTYSGMSPMRSMLDTVAATKLSLKLLTYHSCEVRSGIQKERCLYAIDDMKRRTSESAKVHMSVIQLAMANRSHSVSPISLRQSSDGSTGVSVSGKMMNSISAPMTPLLRCMLRLRSMSAWPLSVCAVKSAIVTMPLFSISRRATCSSGSTASIPPSLISSREKSESGAQPAHISSWCARPSSAARMPEAAAGVSRFSHGSSLCLASLASSASARRCCISSLTSMCGAAWARSLVVSLCGSGSSLIAGERLSGAPMNGELVMPSPSNLLEPGATAVLCLLVHRIQTWLTAPDQGLQVLPYVAVNAPSAAAGF
mmetsp:Transcript_57780/g.125438  ORF Transcript_57780/g.125438 Transcript_57780/m.125438 type:complete len:312 (-) Transcript_57780:42-977(-)